MGHVIGIDTTYTGNPVSFNAVNGGTMKSIVAPITYSQDLHGYANPWPGGGGKNLFDKESLSQISAYKHLKNSYFYTDQVYLKPNTAYTMTPTSTAALGVSDYYGLVFDGVDSDDPSEWTITNVNIRYPVYAGTPTTVKFTTGAGGIIRFAVVASGNAPKETALTAFMSINYQIEEGSTSTAWSPYSNICPISGLTGLSVYVSPTQDPDDATAYNVDWTTQAGTVYGGTLDVVTGVLTANRITYAFNGTESFSNYTSAIVCNIDMPVGYSMAGSDILCSHSTNAYIRFSNSSKSRVQFNKAYFGVSNVDELKTLLENWNTAGTPLQYSYELATPLTYQLTPKRITALIGQNYIWSSNNGTLTAVLTAPATGFAGWLVKCVTNGTPVEIPLKYMRAETYTVTPDQRMEWSAERDVTGVLHRETVQNLPPKIEFSTPLMTNSDINTLNSIIKAAFTNYLQRNITIQFYDPERNQYWEWDCYMPDVKYHIRNADTVNNIINYEELRYAFIGY